MNANRKTKQSRAILLVAALTLLLVFAAPATVRALDSGWHSANQYYSPVHAYDLSRVYSQDGNEARFGEDDDYTGSAYFSFGSNFVPANAYITGIELRIDCFNPYRRTLMHAWLVDNGTIRSPRIDFRVPEGESNNYTYIGSVTDTWGYDGWTPAKINTTNFRILLANFDDDDPVYVDHVQVRIHYTIGHVVTNAPVNITTHSATISGFFDSFSEPNHANTKGLELWDTAGGPVTSITEAAGDDSGTMQADLTDLLSNTQYAYKAGVWYDASPGDLNLDDNVTYGEVKYIITPPEVTTQAATSIASHSAVLNGYTNTEGSRAVSNGFYISSTADTAEGLKALGLQLGSPGEGSFTRTVSGLQANTTYYYLAASYNLRDGGLNFGYGEVMSFTTLPDPPVVTAHPANRTITYGANTTFTASATGLPAPSATWQVSSDAGATWSDVEGDVYSISTSRNEETGAVSSTLTLAKPPVALSGCRYRAVFANWAYPAGIASNAATLTVNRANASIVVSGWSGPYDNGYHGAALVSASGVGEEDLSASVSISSVTYKDVPGGNVHWSFSNTNYNSQSDNAAIIITPVDAVIVVDGWSGTYDGEYHGATLVSATGVGGENLSASVSVGGATFKNVPGGTVSWSFSNPNYNPRNANADITIIPAIATIHVEGWNGVYDKSGHTAHLVSAEGVGGEDLSASVSIEDVSYQDEPGGWVNWSFANPNYIPQEDRVQITISPADAMVVVNGWSGVYDGNDHGAVLGMATGVGGEDLSSFASIDSSTYRDVPGGSVTWSFNCPNYNLESGSVDVTITPADAMIRVRGWRGYYDGSYHGIAMVQAFGVEDEDLGSYVTTGPETYRDVPGGSILWSFSHPNYLPENGIARVIILPAPATIVVNGWNGTYDGEYHGATLVSATGVGSEDLSASVVVGAETYKDVPGGLVHWTFSNSNYITQEGDAIVSIGKASLNVTAQDKNSQYSDPLEALSCTITGFIGSDDTSVLSGVPVLATAAESTSPAGDYVITVDVSGLSAINYDFTAINGTYVVTREDAAVFFENTLTSQLVAAPGGNAPAFVLAVDFKELLPDNPAGSSAAGDISKLLSGTVRITLTPVGPGGSFTSSSATIVWNLAGGYDGIATATVAFPAGLPVNTYEVKVELLDNPYYQLGNNASVFTIYDPSLGFTTGGGWFYWPGTADPATGYPGDRTNFGYTMQYGKNGTSLKGNLLVIRHLANGDIYRIKSNALDAGSLTLGTTSLPMGWATFSGKCTFTAISDSIETTFGNVPFRVYVEDRNEPGSLADRFWIEVPGYEALTMTGPAAGQAVCLQGGNLFVPHAPAKK